MSKRKPNLKLNRCPRCFMGTNDSKCPRCKKPTVPVKDLHAKIVQESLE